ncbi:helix-turn-helix domain-containing protein [Methanocaldococcus infernus]|uniref:HTH arsR-type domain-containing protein n=1 Tax=Methanocaldococcus infernus (strain DSM 11812 / JCM 15783 / ME) TaxID=573063 RepID=D5VQD6_METIM|nr:hypothetical protein [Methanocaldococcus infernus]ADG12789.1 conserved hypothetical protein [Methanocaldococcus infernus ME]
MERLPYEVVSTIFRKAILHYLVITGSTFPTSLAKNLNISKGLASSFLRLCSALNILKRERIGHKVVYSFTSKGLAILKRLAPEIFDPAFSNVFESLPYKKFSIKHYPLATLGFELKWKKDSMGGYTFSFYTSDKKLIGIVFRSYLGRWWCSICQSDKCKHIDYLNRLFEKIKDSDE